MSVHTLTFHKTHYPLLPPGKPNTTNVESVKQVKNWQSPSRDLWSNSLMNSRETTKGQTNYYSVRQKDKSKTICGPPGYRLQCHTHVPRPLQKKELILVSLTARWRVVFHIFPKPTSVDVASTCAETKLIRAMLSERVWSIISGRCLPYNTKSRISRCGCVLRFFWWLSTLPPDVRFQCSGQSVTFLVCAADVVAVIGSNFFDVLDRLP